MLAAEPDRFELTALGASGNQLEALIAQAEAHRPKVVAVANAAAGTELAARLPQCGGAPVTGPVASSRRPTSS